MATPMEATNDDERAKWLAVSEVALRKTWDNEADDVFNELLPLFPPTKCESTRQKSGNG